MLVSIVDAVPFSYVTNGGTGYGNVSVIDTVTNNVTAKVPVGYQLSEKGRK